MQERLVQQLMRQEIRDNQLAEALREVNSSLALIHSDNKVNELRCRSTTASTCEGKNRIYKRNGQSFGNCRTATAQLRYFRVFDRMTFVR